MSSLSIRILEKDHNRRGDLFARLVADLFLALGYEQPRMNIHQSGKEVDLKAEHRLERRSAIAECKAWNVPAGGDAVNKFVGIVDAERSAKVPVTGYFISLSGFTETAIEQEKQGRRTKIVLLTGPEVIRQLIYGRIIVPQAQAIEIAGRCCSTRDALVLDPDVELLAHQRGWIWTVYYTHGKARTHYVLVHSDGTLLSRALADEIAAADAQLSIDANVEGRGQREAQRRRAKEVGKLQSLTCLNPTPTLDADSHPDLASALASYAEYLENECGYVQLDGLPADAEIGSRRLRLENIFVPLHLDIAESGVGQTGRIGRQEVGHVLSRHSRLAILAAPGGGKSTLLKRLAIAYVRSERRAEIQDDLPVRDWLPLFFRCRELRELARGSFADLLDALAQREPVRQHALVFRAYLDRMLLGGRVLLLIDGLDEISDSGDRAAFVSTLRTALFAYPGIAFVATSREAGFRHVAAHLAPVCATATLSPFDFDDVCRLSVAWHREVVGDSAKMRVDAEELAGTIAKNDRINRLAINPLLLTTLLLVRRWVGSLPTRRAVLYGKAVEVLLMTWNTEGHDPIPEEEALPQLCYVAFAMMLNRVQKISRRKLAMLLQEARDALPTELGYVKDTVDQFIHRVEDRSSLLMMTGHDIEDGRLVEFFEFRHLTFQEYLAAQAVAEGWYGGLTECGTLVDVLEPYVSREDWQEVIPLAAVLAGKEAESLIRRLTAEVESINLSDINKPAKQLVFKALGNCLADEAPARPQTVRAAIQALLRFEQELEFVGFMPMLTRGRYGSEFREEARRAFLSTHSDANENAGIALAQIVWWQVVEREDAEGFSLAGSRILDLLRNSETSVQCEGALGCMFMCYRLQREELEAERSACAETLQLFGEALVPMVFSGDEFTQYVSSFALTWLSVCRVWYPPAVPDAIGQLCSLWINSPNSLVRRMAGKTVAALPLMHRGEGTWGATIPHVEVRRMLLDYNNSTQKVGLLVAAWYLHACKDWEIEERAVVLNRAGGSDRTSVRTLRDLLNRTSPFRTDPDFPASPSEA